MGQILGVRLLLLDVTPEGGEEVQTRLHRFYAAMGFKPLPDRAERLFLSLRALPYSPDCAMACYVQCI